MAKDKLVDSARLDGALRATADKIRSKTGGNAPIAFDDDTGFALAVDAIQAGGGGGSGDLVKQIIERTATEISDSTITNVGSMAFYNYTKLAAVDFPACTNIGEYAFRQCNSLGTASFPACTNIGVGAFMSCANLKTANFLACTTIQSSGFYYCSKLATASFPNLISINAYAFRNCSSLSALILAGSSFCSASTNAIAGTRIASGSGYVFVRRSLVDTYKTAQVWSSYAAQISAIEDSEFA